MSPQLRLSLLAIATALSLSSSLSAQTPARTPDRATTRVAFGGAVGASPSAGPLLHWEGRIAYGRVVAAYQDTRSDDFNGDTRHQQAVFGGLEVPWRRLSVLLAAGAGNTMRCSGAGDQSSLCTRTRDRHVPMIKLAADLPILPIVGLYASTSQPLRRDVAFPTYVLGLEVGKLR